ncbi:DUF4190 domain-containing protein [Streptomyces mashuensis]|nr:DUF4190 domain-containing protein [Streptomyces mashuensis]
MSDYYQNPYGSGQPAPPPQPPQAPPQPGYGYPSAGPAYPAAPPVQQPYAAPGYPAAPGYAMGMQPSNGLGTAGLVCGIIGVVLDFTLIFWFVGVILGILAIIFGALGRGKANRGEATNKGAATGGLICGIVATVLIPLVLFIFFASVIGLGSATS